MPLLYDLTVYSYIITSFDDWKSSSVQPVYTYRVVAPPICKRNSWLSHLNYIQYKDIDVQLQIYVFLCE